MVSIASFTPPRDFINGDEQEAFENDAVLTDAQGRTEFLLSCACGRLQSKCLRDDDIMYATDKVGRNAIHNLAVEGHAENLIVVLSTWSKPVDASDKFGNSPLHLACRNGHTRVVETLIKKGHPIEPPGRNGLTPLHEAVRGEFEATVTLLLLHGANPNLADSENETPLHYAAEKGYVGLAELLIHHGAGLHPINDRGMTPLHLACAELNGLMIKILIANGAQGDVKDKCGNTPLALIVQQLIKPTVKLQSLHRDLLEIIALLQSMTQESIEDILPRDWTSMVENRTVAYFLLYCFCNDVGGIPEHVVSDINQFTTEMLDVVLHFLDLGYGIIRMDNKALQKHGASTCTLVHNLARYRNERLTLEKLCCVSIVQNMQCFETWESMKSSMPCKRKCMLHMPHFVQKILRMYLVDDSFLQR